MIQTNKYSFAFIISMNLTDKIIYYLQMQKNKTSPFISKDYDIYDLNMTYIDFYT